MEYKGCARLTGKRFGLSCTFCDRDLISLWLEADPGDLEGFEGGHRRRHGGIPAINIIKLLLTTSV
jgi:hypothetical protein